MQIVLGIVLLLTAAQIEATIYTVEYGGKKYEFHVTAKDLSATPQWPANQPNPPLAPRRAVEIASKQLASLLPNGKDWRLHQVALRPLDSHWIYLVDFLEPIRPGVERQVAGGFQIVVLMNGVAVTPKVN